MAKEQSAEERSAEEQSVDTSDESLKKMSILNPKLEPAVYTFADGKTFRAGIPVPLSDEEHEKYASEKHGGRQVIVRV